MEGPGFGIFLQCWAGLVLLPPALSWLWRFDIRRLHSLAPVLLLIAGYGLRGDLPRLAGLCEGLLRGFAPTAFLLRSLDLPLS